MTNFKWLPLLPLLVLYGCKVQVQVPDGGSVTTVSGAYTCNAGQSCEVEISDLLFDEKFVAVPGPGMKFTEWKERSRGFFGGSKNPEARLSTAAFEGNAQLTSFLDNDEVFYLEPVFTVDKLGSATVAGGSPSSPSRLSLNRANRVENNSFYNYFIYRGQKGEKLILRASLSVPLSDTDKSRCGSSGGGSGAVESPYDTQIHVYDSGLDRIDGICGEGLTFEFPETGNYIIQFDYPNNGAGYGYAASIKGDQAFTAPVGIKGTPSNPGFAFEEVRNPLDDNPFFNYYRYTADEGEKIVISVALDQPMSVTQKTRCGSSSRAYDTQIYVYDMNLNWVGGRCGEDLTFEFPESGTYFLHFGYGAHSAGYFTAAIIR